MPVGLAIGGAAIGAAATIGSGMLASDAQRDAARTAADTSYQTAQLNNDLYRDIWNQNYGVLAPYAQGGLPAMYMMNDLLGISDYPMPAAPAASGMGGAPAAGVPATGGGALAGFAPGVAGQGGSVMSPAYRAAMMGGEAPMMNAGSTPGAIMNNTVAERPVRRDFASGADFRDARGDFMAARRGTAPAAGTAGGTTGGTSGGTSSGALDAFERFRQGTNYQWRLNEGMGALNQSYAANGIFESGAADKARIKYGQNFASNELANYMNLLAGQQAMGLSAAGAVAGVGTTYAGNVAAQNTMAGNAASNAALMAGQGQAGMWGAIGQGVGQLGGALTQYGMGQMQPQYQYAPASGSGYYVGGQTVNPYGGQYAPNFTGGW